MSQTPAEKLARAQKLVDEELRFKQAVSVVRSLLAEPDLRHAQRVEAYRLLGIAYAAQGADQSAEAAFAELLGLEPDFVLDPLLSPKIRSAFEKAKTKTWKPPRIVDISAAPDGRRVTVSARVEDPDGRLAQVLLRSTFGARAFDSVEMTRKEDRVESILMLPALDHLRVDYFLEGVDRTGLIIARAGSAESPSSVVVERQTRTAPPPPEAVPEDAWYEQWWIWAVVAGVIGAGVAVTVVAVEMDGGSPPNGTLDPIQLE